MEPGLLITREILKDLPDGTLVWYVKKPNGAAWTDRGEGGEPEGLPRYGVFVKDPVGWLEARGLRVSNMHRDLGGVWATWMTRAYQHDPDGIIDRTNIAHMPVGTMFCRPLNRDYELDQQLDAEEDLL